METPHPTLLLSPARRNGPAPLGTQDCPSLRSPSPGGARPVWGKDLVGCLVGWYPTWRLKVAGAPLWDSISHVAEGWAMGPPAHCAHSCLCRNLDSLCAALELTLRCAFTLPGLRDNMDGANRLCGDSCGPVTWEHVLNTQPVAPSRNQTQDFLQQPVLCSPPQSGGGRGASAAELLRGRRGSESQELKTL